MKTIKTIQKHIEQFEAQFRPAIIPAGTEFRRKLQAEADAEARRLALLPKNIARRLKLHDKLNEAEKKLKAAQKSAAAKLRATSPEVKIRRAIQSELREAGFALQRSAGGSNYYERFGDAPDFRCEVVRVSDHHVPHSDERQWNTENGRTSWADRAFLNVQDFDTPEEARQATREFISD